VHRTRILFLLTAWDWSVEITANSATNSRGTDTFKGDTAFLLLIKVELSNLRTLTGYLQDRMIASALIALFRVQHSEYRNDNSA
jgi:hypothetical protein